MLSGHRRGSPASDTMSEGTLERNRAEKALIMKAPTYSQFHKNNASVKSDKNGNEVRRQCIIKGRKTFAFWTLVILLFVLTIANILLTLTMFGVLRLGMGMESMEFLSDENAIKFFGDTDFETIYKRDGLIESYRDTPLVITCENGSVYFNLQVKSSRYESKMVVNTSGVFIRGVNALEVIGVETGEMVFSTAAPEMNVPDGVHNLQAKQIAVKRLLSPVDEDLTLRSESSAHLRGAEGTHMEAKELNWHADQDIHLKSVNGSVVLSGKEGVFLDVRYLPIASTVNKTEKYQGIGHFKLCVCMPQGKLFRIAVPNGQKVFCSHVNMTGDLNPCI